MLPSGVRRLAAVQAAVAAGEAHGPKREGGGHGRGAGAPAAGTELFYQYSPIYGGRMATADSMRMILNRELF